MREELAALVERLKHMASIDYPLSPEAKAVASMARFQIEVILTRHKDDIG